jgi:uncharacterized protein (DUF1800 family)
VRPLRHLPIDDAPSSFTREQASRLLWRAGFGPRRGDAEALAALGMDGAVRFLLEPPAYAAAGPEPTDSQGRPIAPQDAAGHDHLWWLDRMVRGNQPLVERMTLVWHDWFATSNQGVGSQKLMLAQNQLFRANWAGSFRELLLAVTQDPAMLLWLNGNRNRVGKPNENYAREMMELFTLGADQGYTEQDVREQARALTGWRNDNSAATGPTNFRYDAAYHDGAAKTVFAKTGNFGWQDACQLALESPAHPPFFVRKLWSYFIPLSELDAPTQTTLEQLYVSSGYQVKPVLRSILFQPALHTGPRMMKPAIVYNAGLLRMSGRYVDAVEWSKFADAAGQRLFYPPNVAGWDDERWLDTQTFRARWVLALQAITKFTLDSNRPAKTSSNSPDAIIDRALAYWDNPKLTRDTLAALKEFTTRALADGGADPVNQARYAVLAENALRQLIAVSPDFQTC